MTTIYHTPRQCAKSDRLLGDRLIALGLQVEELTSVELTRATTLRRERKDLSTADTFAFAIAEGRQWTLLTGDGGLRRLAAERQVSFHGVLWICDEFEQGRHVPLPRLHAGLSALSSHPRCRLPAAAVRRRLDRYAR